MRFAIFIAALILSSTAFAQQKVKAPTGLWLTENQRSAIELYQCKTGQPLLCGRIAWIIDGGMQYDTKNPDTSKHTRPLCGLTILSGLRMDSPTYWTGGKVYKADEGDMYDASMTVLSDGEVEMRGYMGISLLGKSQKWKRVSAEDYHRCKAPTAQ